MLPRKRLPRSWLNTYGRWPVSMAATLRNLMIKHKFFSFNNYDDASLEVLDGICVQLRPWFIDTDWNDEEQAQLQEKVAQKIKRVLREMKSTGELRKTRAGLVFDTENVAVKHHDEVHTRAQELDRLLPDNQMDVMKVYTRNYMSKDQRLLLWCELTQWVLEQHRGESE